MSTVKWHAGRMGALDTETTGVDPHTDRIITAAIVHTAPGQRPKTIQWLIHPGDHEIPTEASDVHGWTLPRLEAKLDGAEALRITDGRDVALTRTGAIDQIGAQVATIMHAGAPLVAANAAFDLTLLEAELVREGIDPISARPTGIRGVVDPMVLDKAFDQYRKTCYKAAGCDPEAGTHECTGCRGGRYACSGCGSTDRRLESLCRHYGVRLPGAHTADADALAALRLTVKLASLWPDIARLKLETLHKHQVDWRRQSCDSLRKFFDRIGKEHDGVCGEWPVHAACAPVGAGVAR